jgi:hypothetical protein
MTRRGRSEKTDPFFSNKSAAALKEFKNRSGVPSTLRNPTSVPMENRS